MKYVFMLFLLSLLLLAACGGDEVAPIVCNESAPAALDCPETTCPLCEQVECPEAEALDCQVEGDRVDLSLDDIELHKMVRGRDEDVTVAKYSEEEFDKLKSASFSFTALCDEAPGNLEIRLEGKDIYDDEPPCNKEVLLSLDIGDIFFGRNTFLFITDGNVDYEVGLIELRNTFINGSSAVMELLGVALEPATGDRVNLRDLKDVEIKNYQELEIDLTVEETKEDLLLAFNGDNRDGVLIILVNEEELYSGTVQRRLNEITIPQEMLRKGKNYITFVGVTG